MERLSHPMTDSFAPLTWSFRDRVLELGTFPLMMGIVNVTPDSFSDGGQFFAENGESESVAERATEHGLQLIADGADILDIGGESTRPGATPVSLDDELARVIPVVQRLRSKTDAMISVDTTKAEVARTALLAGADIINDISGLTFDTEMPGVCAEFQAGIICMHIKGTPQTMQNEPTYEDCVSEIQQWLTDRLNVLAEHGIPAERVVLDPGIGFGKTAEHNLEILASVQQLRSTGRPILIGHSRKRFLSKVLGKPVEERTFGTVGVSVAVATQGADIIRVHDVAANKDAITAWHAVASRSKIR